jgi:hypothetical protein
MECLLECLKIDHSLSIYGYDFTAEMFHTMQHGMMLGSTAHRDSAVATDRPKNRSVITFCATARKHHFAGCTAENFGHVISRLINCQARRTGKAMASRGIGELVGEVRCHRSNCSLSHRSGRGMI